MMKKDLKKQNELFKTLKFIKNVYDCKWETVRHLVKSIIDKKTIIKEKEWKYFNNDKLLDLSDINTWSTFDETCIELNFFIKSNKILCSVKIYNGDCFSGERMDLRFTALLEIKKEFLIQIENSINLNLRSYMNEEYEKHLNKQKEEFFNNLRNNILA